MWGQGRPRRLWDELGGALYEALQVGDVSALATHVGPAAAHDLVAAFALLADEVAVLRAYDKYGIDPRAAIAACALWGRDAIRRLTENPYCINVVEDWKTVDARALRLGVAPADDRRLLAAVAEACAGRYAGRDWNLGGNLANNRRRARAHRGAIARGGPGARGDRLSRRPSRPVRSLWVRTASSNLAAVT